MNRLYVHIGRHKTGTTSVQWLFCENFEKLKDLGIYYPISGREGWGHHRFASSLTRDAVESGFFDQEANVKMRIDMLHEIEEQITQKNVLISSEALQGCDPALLNEILTPFKPIYIVYLREQVGYLLSSYTEDIRSTDMTLTIEEYIDNIILRINSGYDAFLNIWAMEVGEDNLNVNVYDRRSLYQGDIVKDFLKLLGIQEIEWENLIFPRAEDQNRSLGKALTEFKRLLNIAKEPQTDELRAVLTQLILGTVDRKPEMDKDCYNKIVKRYEEGNKFVNGRYFHGQNLLNFPSQSSFPDKTFPELDKETVQRFVDHLQVIYPNLVNTSVEKLLASR